jgi:hypothetical protein
LRRLRRPCHHRRSALREQERRHLADGHANALAAPDAATDRFDFQAFGEPIGFTAADVKTVHLFGGDGEFDEANGVSEDYAYDGLGRLDQVIVKNGSNFVFTQDYTLRADGNRDFVVEKRYDGTSSNVANFTGQTKIDWDYDAQSHLTQEKRDEGNNTTFDAGDYVDDYGFDLSGNRRSKGHDAVGTANDQTVTSTYNDRDQLVGEDSTVNANDRTSVYDANGSLSPYLATWSSCRTSGSFALKDTNLRTRFGRPR